MARLGRSFPNQPLVQGGQLLAPVAPVSVACGVAEQSLSVVDPAVVLGSVSLIPTVPFQTLSVVDPTVAYGSQSFGPGLAEQVLTTLDPSVVLSTQTFAAGVAEQVLSVVEPTAILGSITLGPGVAEQTLTVLDPTVITTGGGTVVACGIAEQVLTAIDPAVVLGSQSFNPGVATQTYTVLDLLFGGDLSVSCGVAEHTLSVSMLPVSPPFTVGTDFDTPMDPWIPDFVGEATIWSVADGAWTDTATWSGGVVPVLADDIRIDHRVVIDDATAACHICAVDIGGKLVFGFNSNTSLECQTLFVNGKLVCGYPGFPIPASYTAEIVFTDEAIDKGTVPSPGFDPAEYGGGLVATGTSEVYFCGTEKLHAVELAVSPVATDTELDFGATDLTGWEVGDLLCIGTSRQLKNAVDTTPSGSWVGKTERALVTITSIDTVNNIVDGFTQTTRLNTDTTSLDFAYPGAVDHTATEVQRAWVGNMTRNVILRGENHIDTAGTPPHSFTTGNSVFYMHWVETRYMGRTQNDPVNNTTFDGFGVPTAIGTNQIARYAVHTHHCFGRRGDTRPYQFEVVGCVGNFGNSTPPTTISHATHHGGTPRKWWMAIHESSDGLVDRNVTYNTAGSAIVLEKGSEVNTLVSYNFNCCGYSYGSGNRYSQEGSLDGVPFFTAREATGIWSRGTLARWRGNVACEQHAMDQHETSYGLKIIQYLQTKTLDIRVDRGDNPDTEGVTVNPMTYALTEFADNISYSNREGHTIWWLGAQDTQSTVATEWSSLENNTVWHCATRGLFRYQMAMVKFENYTYLNDYSINPAGSEQIASDYWQEDIVFNNPYCYGGGQGFETNSTGPGPMVINGGRLDGFGTGSVKVQGHTTIAGAPAGWTRFRDKAVYINNVTFGTNSTYDVWLTDAVVFWTRSIRHRNDVYVTESGDWYRLWWNNMGSQTLYSQEHDASCPQTAGVLEACPVSGLDNETAFATYDADGNTPGTGMAVYLDFINTAEACTSDDPGWPALSWNTNGITECKLYVNQTLSVVDPTVVIGMGGTVVSPGVAEQTLTVIDPTVSITGSASVVAGMVDLMVDVLDPTVLYGSATVPAGIALQTLTVVDPTVLSGGAVADPGVATQVLTVVDPGVEYGSAVAPCGVAEQTLTVIDPVIMEGNVTVSVGVAEQVSSVVDPTVIYGSLLLVTTPCTQVCTTLGPNVAGDGLYLIGTTPPGCDYQALDAFIDDLNAGTVGVGEDVVALVCSDLSITAATSAITAAGPNSLVIRGGRAWLIPKADGGAWRIIMSDSHSVLDFSMGAAYAVTVEDLEINYGSEDSGDAAKGGITIGTSVDATLNRVMVRNMLSTGQANGVWASSSSTLRMNSSVVAGIEGATGAYGVRQSSSGRLEMDNCVVHDITQDGGTDDAFGITQGNGLDSRIRNTSVTDVDIINGGSGTAVCIHGPQTQTSNLTSDATGDLYPSTEAVTVYNNTQSPNYDFRIKPFSVAVNTGTDLGAVPAQIDMIGQTRVDDEWDIGVYEAGIPSSGRARAGIPTGRDRLPLALVGRDYND